MAHSWKSIINLMIQVPYVYRTRIGIQTFFLVWKFNPHRHKVQEACMMCVLGLTDAVIQAKQITTASGPAGHKTIDK
jgi:hypothetical protein